MDKPILFSSPMVTAILADKKTMTRRVIKPQPLKGQTITSSMNPNSWAVLELGINDQPVDRVRDIKCRFEVGDRLWVRETFCASKEYDHLAPRDIPVGSEIWFKTSPPIPSYMGYWRPSIFMPRWASRITLEVTEVRVERLDQITEQDCIEEGITDTGAGDLRGLFAVLWSSINEKRGYPWSSSPWVWVISFKRIKQE